MGRYVNNNLLEDEQVQYETTYHWITFCNLRAIITLFIAPLIDKYTSEFAITNKRVIIKIGLIRRHTLEMNLNQIESIKVDQTIVARILNYGTIIIIGSGGTREAFQNIKRPLEFRKQCQKFSG